MLKLTASDFARIVDTMNTMNLAIFDDSLVLK